MRSSVGTDTPENRTDADRDGAPDRSEREFAEDGRSAVPPATADATPPAPPGDVKADHGDLESARRLQGEKPPASPR